MASTLTVDNIVADTIVGGTSSSKVHAPGHVVQVVTNNVTGVVGQNSTAWVNMISVSITPHFSNSKMYISAFIGGVYMNLSSQYKPI